MSDKIGIFQYDLGTLYYVISLCKGFQNYNINVDIFLCNNKINKIDLQEINKLNNTQIYIVDKSLIIKISGKIVYIINKLLKTDFSISKFVKNYLQNKSLKKFKKNFCNNKYNFLIGIEKKGLSLAGFFAEKYNIPLIYYSLELYIHDTPESLKFLKDFLDDEKKYHKKAIATIIQDKFREKELFKFNNIQSKNVIYFPVSAYGEKNTTRSFYFHKKYNLNNNKKIILYFGSIVKERFIFELIEDSKKIPDDFYLVFHSIGKINKFYKIIKNKKNIIYSNEYFNIDNLSYLISSCYIGLAFYNQDCLNNKLTAFSSLKIALYLQSGVPFIAFKNENYEYLNFQFNCCYLINNFSELNKAIEMIDTNYENYRKNCFLAYEKYYNFNNNFKNLIDFLNRNFHP